MHFRFWGRHLAFAYPLLILYIAVIIDIVISSNPPKYFYFLIYVTLLFWGYSDFQIRFNSEYQKDNYKLAVQEILSLVKKHNYNVVFAGDYNAARYYGLYISDSSNISTLPKILKVYRPDVLKKDFGNKLNKNIIVLFNKYDLFDPQNFLRNYIVKNNYSDIFNTQDFSIYEQKE